MKQLLLILVLAFSYLSLAAARPAFADQTPLPAISKANNVLAADTAVMNKGISIARYIARQRMKALKHAKWLSLHNNLQDRQWAAYRRWMLAYRGGWVNSPSIELESTAYDPGPISCGPHATGRTATGMHAAYGIAAVDPTVIPLGTHLYVEGYGYAIAADTGSAIKGDRIDLCFNTYGEAIQYGRKRVRVYILGR